MTLTVEKIATQLLSEQSPSKIILNNFKPFQIKRILKNIPNMPNYPLLLEIVSSNPEYYSDIISSLIKNDDFMPELNWGIARRKKNHLIIMRYLIKNGDSFTFERITDKNKDLIPFFVNNKKYKKLNLKKIKNHIDYLIWRTFLSKKEIIALKKIMKILLERGCRVNTFVSLFPKNLVSRKLEKTLLCFLEVSKNNNFNYKVARKLWSNFSEENSRIDFLKFIEGSFPKINSLKNLI